MAKKSRSSAHRAGERKNRVRGRPDSDFAAPLNHEQARLQDWLRQVRFKKTLFGGVRESDLWKKLLELNSIYEAALSAERARYDALLAQCAPVESQPDDEDYDEPFQDSEAPDDLDFGDDSLNYEDWDFLDYEEHGRLDDE